AHGRPASRPSRTRRSRADNTGRGRGRRMRGTIGGSTGRPSGGGGSWRGAPQFGVGLKLEFPSRALRSTRTQLVNAGNVGHEWTSLSRSSGRSRHGPAIDGETYEPPRSAASTAGGRWVAAVPLRTQPAAHA